MNLPGFTADDSLYRAAATYRAFRASGAASRNVLPQQIQIPEVSIPLDICPGGSVRRCLRQCAALGGSANDMFLCGFACRFLCTGPS